MPFIPPYEWGLQSDIIPRFGARLVRKETVCITWLTGLN